MVFLPASPSAGFSSGDKSERLPTDDGGREVIEVRFIHPTTALEEFKDGKIRFMPPQFYILTTLRDILKGKENTLLQRETIRRLSQGAFGQMVINPKILPERDSEGRTILVYEGDEIYGGSKGCFHRAVGLIGKGGVSVNALFANESESANNQSIVQVPKELTLLRNFDIFAEIETQAFGGSKL